MLTHQLRVPFETSGGQHHSATGVDALAAYGEIFGTTPDIMTFGQSGHPDEAIAELPTPGRLVAYVGNRIAEVRA